MHLKVYQRVIKVDIHQFHLPFIYSRDHLFSKSHEKLNSFFIFELWGQIPDKFGNRVRMKPFLNLETSLHHLLFYLFFEIFVFLVKKLGEIGKAFAQIGHFVGRETWDSGARTEFVICTEEFFLHFSEKMAEKFEVTEFIEVWKVFLEFSDAENCID